MVQDQRKPRYAAFISYRHLMRDRLWANWALEALETYRTPPALRAQNYPDRLGKLFRDEDEIPASDSLTEEIEEALAASDNLIVVCSPETPKSRYVRKEIERFQEMGKGHRIFPLLIDGEPAQSFPPALLQKRHEETLPSGEKKVWFEEVEPMAADVRPRPDEPKKETEKRALLRLAAALLGCSYDDLRRREDERVAAQRKRLRRRLAVAAAIILVGSAGLGAGYWNQNLRVSQIVCANYGERWGEPFCVSQLEDDYQRLWRQWSDGDGAWKGRNTSYRLTYQAGHVIRMERLNGHGELDNYINIEEMEELSGQVPALWEYPGARGEHGSPTRILQFDRYRTRILELFLRFEPEAPLEATLDFRRAAGAPANQVAKASVLAGGEADTTRRSNIDRHILSFDESGLLRCSMFAENANPAPDADGVFGRCYTYSDLSQVEATTNVDEAGANLATRSGVATEKRLYENGYLVSLSYLDPDGNLVAGNEGYAGISFSRDELGRILQVGYFDPTMKPVLHRTSGAAAIAHTTNEWGDYIEARYLDRDGKPVGRRDTGYATIKWSYPVNGDYSRVAYFNAEGAPTIDTKSGVARIDRKYDAARRVAEEQYFDASGQPASRLDWGVHKAVWTNDGNVETAAYFDTRNEPAYRRDWKVHSGRWELVNGNVEKAEYFDVDGKPAVRRDFGFARGAWRYSKNGVIEGRYYGPDGAPASYADRGAAKVTWSYDEKGNNDELRFFRDFEETPIADQRTGAEHIRWTTEALSESEAYFDATGRPVLRKEWGIHRTVWKYNARGFETEVCYFDTIGDRAIRRGLGAACIKRVRDPSTGAEIERQFLDQNMEPIAAADWGVWSVKTEYNELGQKIAESYFDAEGLPTYRIDLGAARIEWKLLPDGRQTQRTYFDADGRRTRTTDSWGISRVDTTYDERGEKAGEFYFGADDQPMLRKDVKVAAIHWKNGPYGWIEERITDERGRLIEGGRHNTAIITREFDNRGDQVATSYFAADGSPSWSSAEGAHRVLFAYDAFGRTASKKLLDETLEPDQARTFTYEHDVRGNVIRERRLEADGSESAFSYETRRAYDARDNKIEETYWNGPEPAKEGGYSRIKWTYTKADGQDSEAYFNGDAVAVRDDWEIASFRRTIDSAGYSRIISYFDAAGQPFSSSGLEARSEWDYDLKGDWIRKSYFDAKGAPLSIEGVASRERSFDRRGRLVEERAYGTDNQLTWPDEGIPRYRLDYDENHWVNRVELFGPDDKPLVLDESRVFAFPYCGVRDFEADLGAVGFASVSFECARDGKPLRVAFFGVDAKAVEIDAGDGAGVASAEWVYGEDGEVERMIAYDINGNVVEMPGEEVPPIVIEPETPEGEEQPFSDVDE